MTASLQQAAAAALELKRRRRSYPLAYAQLWDNPAPKTSQRRALALASDPGALLTLVLGGNRSGKSELMAQWLVAMAAGRDAYHDGPEGRVWWVRRWLARNALPEDLVPGGPGRVWVGSPAFPSALEQIRPKLRALCPEGTTAVRWDQASEAELRLPNGGGAIVSKAYKQYDGDHQSWEGANVRAIGLDEQPNSYNNLSAAFSRLVDQRGKAMMALTPLRGKADWLYREVVAKSPPWLRLTTLHGADNPHIPQDMRELMLAAVPAWQRASRDVGAFTSPEGAIYSFDRGVHVIPPFPLPAGWVRWTGIDWGSRAPHVVWVAEVPAPFLTPHGLTLQAGDLVAYRELAPRRTTLEPGIPSRRLIEWAKAAEAGTPEGMELVTRYAVADSEDPGAIEDAAEQGWWLSPAEKEAGSVVRGIELVEALHQTVDPVTMEPKAPRMYYLEGCVPVLVEEMEGMRWAEVREGQDPKPDPACSDHGPDALRYLVRHRQSLGFR